MNQMCLALLWSPHLPYTKHWWGDCCPLMPPIVSVEERVKVLMGLYFPSACRIWGAAVAGVMVPHGWLCSPSTTPVPVLPPMGNHSKAGCRTVLDVTYLKQQYSPILYWRSEENLHFCPAAQAVVLPTENSRREGSKYKLTADFGFLRVAHTAPECLFEYITEHWSPPLLTSLSSSSSFFSPWSLQMLPLPRAQ